MKQKIVIKVSISCDRCMSKAMGLVATAEGVDSVMIQGNGRDHLVVVGDGVNAPNLTSRLRMKVGTAELLSVEAVVSPDVAPSPPPPLPSPPPPQTSTAVAQCLQ